MKTTSDTLYQLAMRVYAPKREISRFYEPDLVIPSEYCMCQDGTLPEASLLCLEEAVRRVDDHKIAWGSTQYLGKGAEAIDKLKMQLVNNPRFQVVSNNTIEEASQLCRLAVEQGMEKILVIIDQPHRPRAEIIYEHFLKGTKTRVSFHTVEARWDKPHYSRIQSNRWFWLAGNIAHHCLLRIRGVEAMRETKQ